MKNTTDSKAAETVELTDETRLKDILKTPASYKALLNLGLAKLGDLAKENIKCVDGLKEDAKELRTSARTVGKILAAMKTAHVNARISGAIGKTVTFEDYHKERTGQKPWGKALQCCRVFDELVLTGLMPEKDYDYDATEWLEKSSTIIGLLKAKGLPLNEGDGKEMLEILTERPSDGASKLRKIANGLKGKETVSASGKGPELDAQNFVAILKRGMTMEWNAVPGFEFVFTELLGLVKQLDKMSVKHAASFRAAVKVLHGETGDTTPKPAPVTVEVVTTPEPATPVPVLQLAAPVAEPVETAPVETPDFAAHAESLYGMNDELLTSGVERYYTATGNLPDSTDTLDAWMEENAVEEIPAAA